MNPASALAYAPPRGGKGPETLEGADPFRVLRWALGEVTPGRLILSTAFGPGGLVLMHMLRRMEVRVPVVFIDTLHHFPETLGFARDVERRWALDLRVFRSAVSRRAFEAVHGERLWERDVDLYHRLTKVEPMERALLGVEGWITARRRDQSESRSRLSVVEPGRPLKVNPLADWSRGQVWSYLRAWDIPYHPLHDRGYPSIGDEPLTTPAGEDEAERAGRWRGTEKTECGIHLIGRSQDDDARCRPA